MVNILEGPVIVAEGRVRSCTCTATVCKHSTVLKR